MYNVNNKIRKGGKRLDIGLYIKDYIKSKGLSVTWVADRIGVNATTFRNKLNMNNLESRYKLTADELLKTAKLLNLDLNEVLTNVDIQENIKFERMSADELLLLARILGIDLNLLKEGYKK